MYKVMLPLGYLVMLGVWAVFFSNFWQPFAGNLSLVMKLVMGLVIMMHLIQLAVFKGILGSQLKLSGAAIIDIMLFGVFALWRRWNQLSADKPVKASFD
ncbi:DUF1145 domain-containing protein [Corallincola spongiicola]|uniref:DUF1145 domain-containing protein n=1 Tax=Corallincola spongiicola TaxID=2520508 RepID=A0ABY1WPR4_9GAMM|nr:DUF1145 domain-containing protein [Corallincola spongiicola]TAA45928.1 DUF1145 domain-containing protein [Corallincola spongiicola]